MRRLLDEMKCCSYCGREYAEEVTVCPLDGQPVGEKAKGRKMATAPPATGRSFFDVKLISPISAAGAYRAFIERSDLIFIQIESGPKSILAALAPVLGPAGGLVPLALWLFTKKRDKSRRHSIEQQEPERMLHEHAENFKLYLSEIREAAIEPATWLATSGKAGRLILTVRHGEKLKFEFGNVEEMSNAIHLLASRLGPALINNVEWNGEQHQFQRKKTI